MGHSMAQPLPGLLFLVLLPLSIFALVPSMAHAAAADDCLKTDARPPDMFDQAARDKALKRWIEVCRQALDANSGNVRLMRALARAYGADGQREAEIPLS